MPTVLDQGVILACTNEMVIHVITLLQIMRQKSRNTIIFIIRGLHKLLTLDGKTEMGTTLVHQRAT